MDPDAIFIERPRLHAQLQHTVEESDAGNIRLVWLLGETGQGKTTFIRAYLDEQKEERLTSYAACSTPLGNQPTTALKPHQPLKDIIEDLLTSKSGVHRQKNLVKNISLTVLACMPIVGEIAYGIKEIRRDLSEYKSGKRKVELEKFEDEYIQTLKQLSQESALLLVVDDVQWADRQSILVLQRFFLGDIVSELPIVVVLSGRMDEIQQKSDVLELYNQTIKMDFASEVQIPVFNSEEIKTYYNLRFPDVKPSDELLLWLEKKTGGNPFFLTSYIKHLQLEGILTEDGRQKTELISYKGMPAEIKLVTNWLMKSLKEEELTLLLTASVLGYEFSIHELAHLTQRPVLDLIRNLRKIKALYGILEPVGYKMTNGRESTVYRFAQHAIHTALYNELSEEEKEALHRSVAQYLHSLRNEVRDDPEVLDSIASALALHAQLGHDHQLEYDSLLLKARNTTEPLDGDFVHDRLTQLAENLGRPADQLQQDYRALSVQSPYVTHLPQGSREALPPREDPEAAVMRVSLSGLVFSSLAQIREGETADARRQLHLRVVGSKRRDIDVHPLLVILLALAAFKEGSFDLETKDALEALARNNDTGVYAALARLMLAVSEPGASDEAVIRHFTAIAGYQGKYQAMFRNVVVTVLQTRFVDNPSIKAVLDASPLFSGIDAGGTESATDMLSNPAKTAL